MPDYDDYLDFHYGDECDEIDDLYDDYDDYEEDDSQEWYRYMNMIKKRIQVLWDNYYHTIAEEIGDD
jgi:hypothetical protein